MSYYIPNCPTPPAPVCNPCWVKELGRVRGVALIKQSLAFTNPDWTDPVVWTDGICAGEIYLFPYVNGDVTETEKLSTDYGTVDQTVDSYEYALNCAEPQIQNNMPFWVAAAHERDFVLAYVTETLLWVSTANNTMIVPKAPVANDLYSKVDIKLMFKFVQKDTIIPIVQPSGIFDNCVDCA